MIVFQELNFDPVKEIMKICHIYILMKKVIIHEKTWKIHVKMKSFAPP